jgi:hypothetical protein
MAVIEPTANEKVLDTSALTDTKYLKDIKELKKSYRSPYKRDKRAEKEYLENKKMMM